MAFTYSKVSLLFITIFISISPKTSISVDIEKAFLQCFSPALQNSNSTAEKVVLTQNSSSYESLLRSSIRNTRFLDTSVPKPNLIVNPQELSHIQAAITCSVKQGLQVRIRSGGHDYEGLSYISHDVPFLIIDLTNFRSISIDIESESAWVQSGATLGEFYHAISQASGVHGFPAGSCPTVGVGGHFCGGGFGTIFRKHGLAADQVVDAQIVDVNGKILNRTLMGEDLFWAIKGGGGSSYGVITSWKVKLVPVPPKVTIFNLPKKLDQNVSENFQKWQTIANKLPAELFLHSVMAVTNSSSHNNGGKSVTVSFIGLYLGIAENLLTLMQSNFAELGLRRDDCTEMSWIQSVLYFAGLPINASLNMLLQRHPTFGGFKSKSDYVTEPIPQAGLEGLWNMLLEEDSSMLILTPYGGRMSEISESETPFPHRNGSLYGIQYGVNWDKNEESEMHLEWIRRLYAYMELYVSKYPRGAYLNYRDLDIGVVNHGHTTYEEAKSWGLKYFKCNFERLARVKAQVDPNNFFRHEQSIPPLLH